MPIAIAQPEIDRLKAAIAASFPSQAQFADKIGLCPRQWADFVRGRISPKSAKRVATSIREKLGIDVEFMPVIQARWDKTGVPEFRHEHRHVFNELVREAGFRSTVKLAEAIGFNNQNFNSAFSNHISGDLYHRLHASVLEATGIDLNELAESTVAETAAPGPLNDLHRAGYIASAELAAGQRLVTAANGQDYPGRAPLPGLVRIWSQDLQAMWRALMIADAETDRCRPRLPTASLVAWNVAVGREALDLRDPHSRDALTSLRIALQHLENPS